MSTHARDIVNRLAALDEAVVAEPEVEPDVMPAEPAPVAPPPERRPGPRHDPWTTPPDWEEPGQMPRPKAEDETGSIEAWLEATQQPITDWEWDGQELRLLMNDGSTEVYTRPQLDEIGVFGSMAFAESEEPPPEDDPEVKARAEEGEPCGCEHGEAGPIELDSLEALGGPEDATGTLDAILGRTPAPKAPEAEPMIATHIEGEPAQELTQAVSDVVLAILGAVGDAVAGEMPDTEADKSKDKKGEKSEKSKEKSGKSKDKSKDKSEDEEDDKKESDE